MSNDLTISGLLAAYRAGTTTPAEVIRTVYERIRARGNDAVWIHLVPEEEAVAAAAAVPSLDLPLAGIPFAVKDNIDVAGLPTTAGCPSYSTIANETATTVQRLLDAGAILIGKTNMDQFATGLVGTRTPYGACRSVFGEQWISGGSSSGSGVAVAAGLVSFSLGTDTAGSGRVPAAFNGITGLKPTRGSLSAHGVVPACRSLDCVSVFAANPAEAHTVWSVANGLDTKDVYSRAGQQLPPLGATFRVGVPLPAQREFFGDADAAPRYEAAIAHAQQLGGTITEIDITPLLDCAKLLYGGPWVAERFAAVGEFLQGSPAGADPVVSRIILDGQQHTAVAAFQGQYRLMELRRLAGPIWSAIDVLLLPTAPTIFTVAEVQNDPFTLNAQLGLYTNFVNLMDLAAIAIPGPESASGRPFGISLIAPAFTDARLADLACRWQGIASPVAAEPLIELAVVGAHLTGQPLNHQLTSRGAQLLRTTRTVPQYRFYALPTTPPKPGLVRQQDAVATGIEVEVWGLNPAAFGSFVAEIPGPLGIGTLALEDGTAVKGFLCEPYAVAGAPEITHLGGWRAYLAQRQAAAV